MNNQIKEALKIVSEIFPLSFAYSDSHFKRVHFATSDVKEVVCEPLTIHTSAACGHRSFPKMEMELARVYKSHGDEVEVLKLSSTQNGSQRKLSLFIDIANLEIKISNPDTKPGKLLTNSKFISAYLRLSPREKEIIRCLSRMQTSQEIGSHLFISEHTVKNHRKNIRKKINFSNRDDYSRFLNWVRGFVS